MPLASHKPSQFDWLLPALTLLLFLPPLIFGNEAWLYRRDEVLDGEWWRLISSHFAHLNWAHWLLNGLGVLLVWRLFEPWWRPAAWFAAIGWCALVTGLGILWLSPGITWYGGFSGVLHGLFIFGAALALLEDRDAIAGLVLLLTTAKVLGEQWFGGSDIVGGFIGAAVVTDAHFYGAMAGLLPVPFLHRRGQ